MWEHSFVKDLKENEVESLLEKTIFNGWELVNSHRYTGLYNSTPKYSLFFKRPKQPSREEKNKARFILGLQSR